MNGINGICSGIHGVALNSTVSRSNWNLEMLVFAEGGKPEYPEKNPRSRDENQQQTQPTYDAETGNRTRATLVGGECSHHCIIPAPTTINCNCVTLLRVPVLAPVSFHCTLQSNQTQKTDTKQAWISRIRLTKAFSKSYTCAHFL